MDCGPLQVASTEKKEEANYLLRRNQELCRRQREINREQAWLVGEEERAKESKTPPPGRWPKFMMCHSRVQVQVQGGKRKKERKKTEKESKNKKLCIDINNVRS